MQGERNQVVTGNRKSWKVVGKVKIVKVENCSRVEDGKGFWKECFEDLYNEDTVERIIFNVWFEGARVKGYKRKSD